MSLVLLKRAIRHVRSGYKRKARVRVIKGSNSGLSGVILRYSWLHGCYIVRLNSGRGNRSYVYDYLIAR